MPTFVYKAVDARGAENAGTLTAESRTAAMDQVMRLGFTPVLVKESKAGELSLRKSGWVLSSPTVLGVPNSDADSVSVVGSLAA